MLCLTHEGGQGGFPRVRVLGRGAEMGSGVVPAVANADAFPVVEQDDRIAEPAVAPELPDQLVDHPPLYGVGINVT